MNNSIKLFGDKAKNIKQGQQYIATVFSVEGRDVVELKPIDSIYSYDEDSYEKERQEYIEELFEIAGVKYKTPVEDDS